MIQLYHGAGGRATRKLIVELFCKSFGNPILFRLEDSAEIELASGRWAFSVDAFTVNPIFFEGGDIGKLAVCGVANDLACKGAQMSFLTLSFIIEEGFPVDELEKIAESIGETAKGLNAVVVSGDTKVVERGRGDKLYIAASGIGKIRDGVELSAKRVHPGAKIIISGTIAQHEASIISARENFKPQVKSDLAPIWGIVSVILCEDVLMMRDPTRGGLATVLNEVAMDAGVSITINEDSIPISNEAKAVADILGLDPLYMASEGRVVIFVEEKSADQILCRLKDLPEGKEASIIGEVHKGSGVYLNTNWGGTRPLLMLEGEQLSRIC